MARLPRFSTVNELASSQGDGTGHLRNRIRDLALSQGIEIKDNFFGTAGFILADREQVQDPDFVSDYKIGLFIRCVGVHTDTYKYPPGIPTQEFAVSWANGRTNHLELCLPMVLQALSQGKFVVVHCNQSFHRGPVGLIAILCRLVGYDAINVKHLIVDRRIVFEEYVTGGRSNIMQAYAWAERLRLWSPQTTASRVSQHTVFPGFEAGSSSRGAASPGLEPSAARPGLEPSAAHTFLFRAMRPDQTEFSPKLFDATLATGATLASEILKAVDVGSSYTSPFFAFFVGVPGGTSVVAQGAGSQQRAEQHHLPSGHREVDCRASGFEPSVEGWADHRPIHASICHGGS